MNRNHYTYYFRLSTKKYLLQNVVEELYRLHTGDMSILKYKSLKLDHRDLQRKQLKQNVILFENQLHKFNSRAYVDSTNPPCHFWKLTCIPTVVIAPYMNVKRTKANVIVIMCTDI